MILADIYVEVLLWRYVKKASLYGQNHRAEQLPISESCCILGTKENVTSVINFKYWTLTWTLNHI